MLVISPGGFLPAEAAESTSPCFFQGETVGLFADGGAPCITDVCRIAEESLPAGPVMILYLDGLGWNLYSRAQLPNIRRLFDCRAARAAYPPVSQPCMASMLTGVLPDEHGVLSRRHHKPACPSLLRHEGAVLVEADEELLALETPALLTLPKEGENVDQAVLRHAKKVLEKQPPLMIVHFHGLDDLEHNFGDDLPHLAAKLEELDLAVGTLLAEYHGTAILCADHGVHSEDGHGSHGTFDYRDMYVPLGVARL